MRTIHPVQMANTTSTRLTLHILTLIYIKHSSDQRRKLALLKHESRTILCCEKSE